MENKNEIIEGIHPCIEAIKGNVPITEVFVGNYINLNNNKDISKIIKIANSQNLKVTLVDKKLLDQKSFRGAHQGVIAIMKPFGYTSLDRVIANCEDKSKSLIAILDHIEDAGNLGAIIRSAEAFGAQAVVIPNSRSASVNASTYKTSAGAIFNIPIVQVSNINAALEQLKQHEFWVASASEHTDTNIWDVNLKGKIALVMGSEHDGVSSLVLKNSDFIVKLPMSGKIESLNVAQAFCACAYEWVRQNS